MKPGSRATDIVCASCAPHLRAVRSARIKSWMTNFLTKPITLWILFGLFVAETLCFGVVMAIWDFTIIDEMSDPEKIRGHIAEMSEGQRIAHAWMTATLDVAYPLTYGPLFYGLTVKAFRPVFAIPAVAVVPTDLTEGVIQVLALTGTESVIWLKAYVTPLKLLLFGLAVLIAVLALIVSIRKGRGA